MRRRRRATDRVLIEKNELKVKMEEINMPRSRRERFPDARRAQVPHPRRNA